MSTWQPRYRLKAVNYKACAKNTLKGFVDLITPAGMRIKGCAWHESHGKEWVCFPGSQYIDKASGQMKWANLLEFETDQGNDDFQLAALDALHTLLGRAAEKDGDAGSLL